MNSSHAGWIRLIAVLKLLKAAALIVAGVGILKLIHKDIGTELEQWVARLGFDPGSRFVSYAIEKATHLSPHRIKELGLASFAYAPLFLTEGIGLWLLKRWAEWFTVVITGSLLPVEVYEIYRHPTAVKILVLVVNLAVVAYLLYRIYKEPRPAR
jgi:uncharacterized membrane protein (DUF2068 family)